MTGKLSTHRLLPAVMVLLAVAVRLPSLGWGLPDVEEEAFPLRKALTMGGFTGEPRTLDPETAGWPSLSIYLQMILQHLVYGIGRMAGAFRTPADFERFYAEDPTFLILLSRAFGVLAAAVVVWVGTRIAVSRGGVGGGVLAGGLLALSPLLVRESQRITPDILVAALAALSVYSILNVYARGSRKDYLLAGLWIGLGVSAKYTPAVFGASLILVHVLAVRGREGGSWRRALADGRMWAAAGIAVAAFVLTSPFALLNLAVLQRDVGAQLQHLGTAHLGQEGRINGHWAYLRETLGPGLGWPALLLGVAGLALGVLRKSRFWWAVALCFLPFFAALGFLSTHFDRWILPVLLPVALGTVPVWDAIRERAAGRGRRVERAAFAVLAAAILLPPAWGTAGHHLEMSKPSTMALARDFLLARFPAGSEILAEPYSLVRGPTMQRAADPPPGSGWRLLRLPIYVVRADQSGIYYDLRHYLSFDAVVVADAVADRYRAQPHLFPEHNRFYEDLAEYAAELAAFEGGDDARGAGITVYALPPAGRKRLLAERGPLPPAYYGPYEMVFNTRRYILFFHSLIKFALARNDYESVAFYCRAMSRTTSGESRLNYMKELIRAKLLLEDVASAERTIEEYRRVRPDDAFALACLGRIHELRGELRQAAALYSRAAVADGRGEVPWVRGRLEELRRGGGER